MQRPLSRSAPLLLAVGLAAGCEFPSAPAIVVTIDPAVLYQTVDGFGGSAANESELRGMPEPYRSAVLDLVFGDLQPSIVRVKPRPAIEPVNDDADPDTANAAGFVRPDDHLWQLGEIAARGSPKRIAALWTPPAWMKTTGQECCGGTLRPGMDRELAEFFSAYLGFVEDAGHQVDSLSIQNEPEAASPWDANTYAPAAYADTLETIARRLDADGHAVTLHAPDNAIVGFAGLYLQSVLAKPAARARLEAAAFHHYQYGYYESATIGAAQAAFAALVPADLRLWMTEYSNTTGIGYGSWDEALAQAVLIHETLVNGANAYVMWNLYRPGGPGEALVVIPTQPGVAGFTVTPKYWTLRHFSRWVKPGARRIGATSADADLLATAFHDAAAGRTVAVLINRADEARWAVVEGAVASLGEPHEVVRSSATERNAVLPPDAWDRFGGRSLYLPARSMATVVWPDAGGAPR